MTSVTCRTLHVTDADGRHLLALVATCSDRQVFQLPLSLYSLRCQRLGFLKAAVYIPDQKEGELPEVPMLLLHLEEANYFAHVKVDPLNHFRRERLTRCTSSTQEGELPDGPMLPPHLDDPFVDSEEEDESAGAAAAAAGGDMHMPLHLGQHLTG